MNKSAKIKRLHHHWAKKCLCGLKKTATQAVYGDGNPEAKIIFIGEAPGKSEDKEGKPFVGSSGKFLSEMLILVNLKREDVYITNIVKYRPPNNRDPLPKEKADCQEWLIEEIKIISPKLVVLLGRHAMKHFFPKEQISKVHGKLLKKSFTGIPTKYFYILYHPAVALYNGSMRKILTNDFKKIPKILNKISTQKTQ